MADRAGEDARARSDDGSVTAANTPAPYYEDDFATIYHGGSREASDG